MNSLPSKPNTVAQLSHVMAKAGEQPAGATATSHKSSEKKEANPHGAAEAACVAWSPHTQIYSDEENMSKSTHSCGFLFRK